MSPIEVRPSRVSAASTLLAAGLVGLIAVSALVKERGASLVPWLLLAAAVVGAATGAAGLVARRQALRLDDDALRVGDERLPFADVVGVAFEMRLLPLVRWIVTIRLRGGGTREVVVSDLTLGPRRVHDEIVARAAAANARPLEGPGTAARRRALEHVRAGRPDDALAAFSEALGHDAADATSLYGRALAFAARGDHERAEADLAEAILLRPDHAPAYLQRGRVRLDRGQPALAVEDLTRALELDAGLREALEVRARAHEALGHAERAAADRAAAAR